MKTNEIRKTKGNIVTKSVSKANESIVTTLHRFEPKQRLTKGKRVIIDLFRDTLPEEVPKSCANCKNRTKSFLSRRFIMRIENSY